MLEMDLPDDPMEDSLAGAIRRHRERAHLHTSDTPHRTSDPNKLGPCALLQQWKRRLKEEQRSESIDGDMFLDDRRVTGSKWRKVIADACVGDDEVETRDSLVFDRGYSAGGVGLGFVVDFHNDEFAGRIFVDGGELLRCGVVWVSDTSDDSGRGTGEVGLDKAEADAWGLSSRDT